MLFCREHHTLKPHLPALFIAAAGAGWPLRLCAASPDPPFLRLAAEAWMSFEHPLLRLFLFLAILSLLAAALLKRRRRPELLAVCLALSIVLHLLSLSCFSLLPIRNPKPANEPPRAARRIKVGTRVAGESRVSWLVRYEPLKIERADARDRFLTPRAAGSEPIKEVIQKAQAAAPEPAARTAKQVDFKTPDPNPAKKKLDEPLDSTQDRPLEAEAVKIEIPRENMPAREAAQANPDPGEKRLDVGAAARTPMPRQDVKPEAPAAGPKNASPLPVQAKIAPAAAAPRQPEVKDAIHPSSAKPAVDRLALPAGEIANDRDSGKDGAAATARPGADVKLDKRAGSAPQPAGGRQMLAAAKSDGRPGMSADSLADGSPGSIDRKQSEVQELAPGAMAAATAVEPLRMNDVQPLVAADRTPAPGRNPAADTAAQRELTAARKKGAVPSLGAAGERPRAEAKNAAPSREPARVGLGGEALAEPASKAPAVRDVISDASAKQPGLRSLEKSPSKNMELATDNRDSAGPAMNNLGASDLAAVKISAGSGNLHAAPVPAAPKRDGRSRHAGAAPGTLVEGSGAAIRAGNSAAVQDQLALAQAGAGDLLEHGLPVAVTPAQTLESARGNVPGKEPGIRPAVLSASRKSYSGMPSAAGGIAHPSPAGRSEPTAGGDSFVRQDREAGLATSPAASPSVSQGEQVESAASLALAGGNSKALAGLVSVESAQGEQEAAGAEIQGGREQAGISLEKVEGNAPAPGVPGRPYRAPGNAGSGLPAAQPQTLVAQSGLQAAGRPAAAVQGQLALEQAGAGDLLEHGLPVAATPAQTLEGARGDVPGKEPVIRPAALSASRKSYSGMPSAAGGIAHPSPAGRSEPTAGGDSFVRQDRNAGLATSPAASPAVSQGEQVDSAASLALAAGNSKALAGQVSVESPQGEEGAAGAEIQGGREQAGISLEKVGGNAPDPGVPGRPFQAPGNAGSGLPAAQPITLVAQSGLQAAGRPAASGTAREESLAALDTHTGAPDSSGPALAAPAAIHRGALPDGAAEAGGVPAGRGSLPIEKAGADNAFLFEPPAGGLGEPSNTIGAADRREHSRMDLAMGADAPRARVTADISASTSGQDARRSFLPMGKAPTPDFVPEIAIYKMRKPEKRKQFIKELGGTPQTEEAVEQALAWLSRSQSDDGRWDVDGFKTLKECGGAGDLVTEDVGVTGLVLLAYLGAGYTHLEGAYRETVRKGLDWLLSCQKENGDIRGAGQMYGQAMATTALCESYALTGDERLLEPTRRAVKFILDSQTPESGWQYASQNDSDTSVTGWQILALKSARIAGFDVPDQTFRWMSLWLDKVRQGNDGGLYSYKPGHVVTPVMTAEGAFCHLFIGEEAGAGARAESVAFIMQNLPAWDPEKRSVHIYYWYYATLTMYLSGAKEFESWNSALTGALLKGRNTSGPAAGSWDPVCLLGVRGGRIYTTAVGALCLEVYYRFLPLYKQNQD